MKLIPESFAAGLAVIPLWTAAQVAIYDTGTSILTLPAVQVGATTYANVTLLNIGNYTFRLQNALAGSGPATNTYNVATGVLTLPVVQLGSASYLNVTLQNQGNYTFSLFGAPMFSSAVGGFSGTTQDGRKAFGAILDTGALYLLYTPAGNTQSLGGVVFGNGTSVNGTYSASNALDFNVEGLGVLAGTVSANYVMGQSLNASVTHAGNVFPLSLTAAYDPTFFQPTPVAVIAGTYSGQAVIAAPPQGEILTVTISASGGVSSTDGIGCTRLGQLTPHAGENVFDLSYTEGMNCPFAGQTFTGIANYDARKNQVIVAVTNSGRTTAELFFGTRF